MLNSKSDIASEKKISGIIRNLARNAAEIKKAVSDDNLDESARLVGERTGLIEELRALKDVKVSAATSDIKGEMNLLMIDVQNDVSEAMKTIREKSLELLTGLANMRSAKKIAAYKIQGGRYGY
jgi:hypothetical protein